MLQQSAATPVDLAVVCVAMTDQVAEVSTSVLASIEKRDGRRGWVALEPGDQTSPRELSTGTAQGLHEKLRAGGCSIKISAGGSGALFDSQGWRPSSLASPAGSLQHSASSRS